MGTLVSLIKTKNFIQGISGFYLFFMVIKLNVTVTLFIHVTQFYMYSICVTCKKVVTLQETDFIDNLGKFILFYSSKMKQFSELKVKIIELACSILL